MRRGYRVVAVDIDAAVDPGEDVVEAAGGELARGGRVLDLDLIAGLPGEDLESFGRGLPSGWAPNTSGPVSVVP